ncbi:MAG: DUF4397 domain-containing protein [Gemmatimonadaceae bacterium]
MNLRHATLLLAAALLGACSEETVGPTGAESTQPFGRMRFVNAVPDAATSDRVNVLVEDLPFAVNLAFGVAAPAAPTLYFPVYAGSRKIAVRRTADTTVHVLDASVPIAANTDQTVFAVKQGGVATTVVVTDDNSLPPPDSVKLRVIHLAQSAGNVDIYVTAPNASIATVVPTFANVAPGTVSTYLKLLRGAYQVRFTAPGSTVVILTITTPTLAAGAVRTAVSLDPQTGTALAGVTLTDR